MPDKMYQSIWSVLRGSPIACALLIMYWMGLQHQKAIFNYRDDEFIKFRERITIAVEEMSRTQKEISRDIAEIHAHVNTIPAK